MCLCHAKLVRMTFFPIPAPSLSFFFPPPRCVWMPRALTGIFTHNEVTPYHPPPPHCQLYISTGNWEENGRVTPPCTHRTGRNVLVSTGAVWLGTDQSEVSGVWTQLLFEEPSSVPSSAAFTPNATYPMPWQRHLKLAIAQKVWKSPCTADYLWMPASAAHVTAEKYRNSLLKARVNYCIIRPNQSINGPLHMPSILWLRCILWLRIYPR